MSLVRYTAKCDLESGLHVCPDHRHKAWDELEMAMAEEEWGIQQ